MNAEVGIKKRVQQALEASQGRLLTMGQIMALADIPKTAASDVSSALYKLRNDGLVRAVRGPSTSVKGPRFVRMYQIVVRAARVEPVQTVVSPMAGLGIFRI